MRASTMFALIVAVLLGLALAVAAKATGFLNKPEAKKPPPPPMVLAAAVNVFEGHCLQASDVKLRPMRPDEAEAAKRGELLPPLLAAAVRRFAKTGIPADAAIRTEYLEDMSAPPDLKARLGPGMQAVNVALPKIRCAGGMINVGDWVNVQLTTSFDLSEDGGGNPAPNQKTPPPATMASAVIARNVRIIAKRNSLWPVTQPLAPDAPINFTLEANPYRAGLIEFVKDKGVLSILPLSDTDKRVLEARRLETLNRAAAGIVNVSYNVADNPEYKDEDVRVATFVQGTQAIDENDLIRIFKVKRPAPQPPMPPPPLPMTIEKTVGLKPLGEHVFAPLTKDGPGTAPRPAPTEPMPGVMTRAPASGEIRQTSATKPGLWSPSSAETTPPTFRFRPPALKDCIDCDAAAAAKAAAAKATKERMNQRQGLRD